MKRIICTILSICICLTVFVGCAGEVSDAPATPSDVSDVTSEYISDVTSSISDASVVLPSEEQKDSKPVSNISKADHSSKEASSNSSKKPTVNIDLTKCADVVVQEFCNKTYYPDIKDARIDITESNKRITFSVVVKDGTSKAVAAEYADSIIRRLNLEVQTQGGAVSSASKDYYGGLYDIYDITIGVAELSKVSNSKSWLVSQGIAKGLHQPIKGRI